MPPQIRASDSEHPKTVGVIVDATHFMRLSLVLLYHRLKTAER